MGPISIREPVAQAQHRNSVTAAARATSARPYCFNNTQKKNPPVAAADARGHQLDPGNTITLSGRAPTISLERVRRLPPEGSANQNRPVAASSGMAGSLHKGCSCVTSGTLAKLYDGAGVGIAHSRVPAPQGFRGANLPLRTWSSMSSTKTANPVA